MVQLKFPSPRGVVAPSLTQTSAAAWTKSASTRPVVAESLGMRRFAEPGFEAVPLLEIQELVVGVVGGGPIQDEVQDAAQLPGVLRQGRRGDLLLVHRRRLHHLLALLSVLLLYLPAAAAPAPRPQALALTAAWTWPGAVAPATT